MERLLSQSQSQSQESRNQILTTLRCNQPAKTTLPDLLSFPSASTAALTDQFIRVAAGIGSVIHRTETFESAVRLFGTALIQGQKVISTVPELVTEDIIWPLATHDPHLYEDVDIAVFKPLIAVAENSALWITQDQLLIRALPFITQHIVMLVNAGSIVSDMHEAYRLTGIAETNYGFGTFIAGPSKTADIEQSLVLGAHGPRSMTIYLYG